VHATFDTDDKASGTLRYLARVLGEDPGAATSARYAFLGDSGNDAACFGAFAVTFGVANVRPNIGRIAVPPRYVATHEMGGGFAEVAATILAKRRA
jgi:hydroxymethylpyrimidine pyrophosphatase-like HAD family hydrolase